MIHSLTITNFKSIKEPVTLSFEASGLSDPCEYKSTFQNHKKTMIKAVGLFGKNGSGKSNILGTLALLKDFSEKKTDISYTPYNDKEHSTLPSEFVVLFSLGNTSKTPLLRYSVAYDKEKVVFEKLEKWPSQKPALVFERRNDGKNDKVSFNPFASDKKMGKKYLKTLTPKETLLSYYEESSSDCGQAVTFFRKRLFIPSLGKMAHLSSLQRKLIDDKAFLTFSTNILKAFDSDLSALEIKDEEVYIKYNYERPLLVPLKEEGDGVRRALSLCPYLYECIKEACVLVLDPLDSYLHGEVSALLIKFFLDEHSNKTMSQVVFCSHQSFVLGKSLLRRDGVYFVYRENGSTITHRLKEFGVRTHDNVEKGYDGGKYGTSPTVDERQLWRLKK